MSKQRGNQGTMAGLLGCAFGVLGIFTLGIVFVPLAALCSLIGFLNGLHGNGSGLATSALGAFLTAVGFMASPSLWFLAGGLLLASHNPPPVVANPPVAVAQPVALSAPLARAVKLTETAMAECRAMRLTGVLKTYEASAICSGDRIMQAYANADYKHMDLVAQFNAKRIEIARMEDQHRLTEAEANAQVVKALADVQAIERRHCCCGLRLCVLIATISTILPERPTYGAPVSLRPKDTIFSGDISAR